jgi:hypothetical protein
MMATVRGAKAKASFGKPFSSPLKSLGFYFLACPIGIRLSLNGWFITAVRHELRTLYRREAKRWSWYSWGWESL